MIFPQSAAFLLHNFVLRFLWGENMKQKLWTRNYTLLMLATLLGSIGGVAGGYALSLLVFDETKSTLASAVTVAIQVVPGFLLPIVLAPWMDRMPRKPFLVGGDFLNAAIYAAAGVYLLLFRFSYLGYLCFSLLLATLSAFDQLAYQSIYPKLIPSGAEQKGYAVSAMLYPVVQVVMLPLASILYDALGVGLLLILQGALSLSAALIESGIRIQEERRMEEKRYSLRLWWTDIRQTLAYFRREKGLRKLYAYMAVTNGVASGYSPIVMAFFRTAPGFTMVMYSFFSVAEFAGRTIAGLLQYTIKIQAKRRFGVIFGVYQVYETMDLCLLWLPYPLMLVNRAICGFLGTTSATLRQTAVQQYIPEEMRARVNSLFDMELTLATGVLALLIGALGETMDYRLCMTLCGAIAMTACWLLVWRGRKSIRPVLEFDKSPIEDCEMI